MSGKNGSMGPQLLEIVSAILVFAVTSAVCVSLFASARRISDESVLLSSAVLSAENAAECFKALDGDVEKTAARLGGEAVGNRINVQYGTYILCLDAVSENGVRQAEIRVESNAGTEIFAITAALPEAWT